MHLRTYPWRVLILVIAAFSLPAAGQPVSDPGCPPPDDLTPFETPDVFVPIDLPLAAGGVSSKQQLRAAWHADSRFPASGLSINPISEIWEQYELLERIGNPVKDLYFTGTWKPLGPTKFVPGTELTNNMGGLGRINSLAFDQRQPGRLFAGSAAGGLWLTDDYGSSWRLATRDPRLQAVSGIAIDPVDSQTIYVLTGDGNASIAVVPARPSIGILKSVDGGVTWDSTGLDWSNHTQRFGFSVTVAPDNRCVLFTATNNGIYKSPDAGAHWKNVQKGNFRDFEFKPGDSTVAYASTTTDVYRSLDAGETWEEVTVDVSWAEGDNPKYRRVELGVSPADPGVVYALFGGTTGLVGVFRSDDSAATFKPRAEAPNMLGYSTYGGDASSVAFYALTLGVSPVDVDEVYLGAVNIWKSTDGGSNWTLKTSYKNQPHFFAYVHADTHALVFQPIPPDLPDAMLELSSEGRSGKDRRRRSRRQPDAESPSDATRYALFSANDGGLAVSFDEGETWKHRSTGLRITQAYRVCGTPQDLSLVYFGSQDNGSSLLKDETAYATYRGDGMQCQIDTTDPDIVYFSQGGGILFRSRDGGRTGLSITPPIGTGKGAWLTPFLLDPTDPNRIYACYTDLWMSPDQGTTWSNVTEGALGTNTCVDLAISPAEPRHIWVAKKTEVYRSKDSGKEWATITRNLPVGSTSITRVALSPLDTERAWVTLGGYSDHLKIYGTENGGRMWHNISNNLPNLPANTVVAHAIKRGKKTEHHLFLGTDVGVFFHSEALCSFNDVLCKWLPFYAGMDPLIVLDLELYPEAGKIRAATFSQGIWESDLPPEFER